MLWGSVMKQMCVAVMRLLVIIIYVLFNGKKGLLIIYKYTRSQPPDPGIVINNVRVPRLDEVILLGHCMCEDIYKFNESKCLSDFNRQNNMLLCLLKSLTHLGALNL